MSGFFTYFCKQHVGQSKNKFYLYESNDYFSYWHINSMVIVPDPDKQQVTAISTKLLVRALIGLCLSASAFASQPGIPMGDSAPLLGVAAIILVAGIQYLRNKR